MDRGRSLMAVALVTITVGGCSSAPSGDCYWQGPPDQLCLDEWVITLVWRGTASERTDDGWRFTIDEVLFELGPHTSSEGTTITHEPRPAGSSVVVRSGDGFTHGGQYVIASAEVHDAHEFAYSVYEAETMRPRFGDQPALTDLLDDESATAEERLTALLEYVEQAAAYREAAHTGDPDPSAGSLLRKAWGLRHDPQPPLDTRR